MKSTSIWADHIIIADQNSTDGSREIISRYPKAELIENSCGQFNELQRQQMLLKAARSINGPSLLIALDADEILSPEAFRQETWQKILKLKRGTILRFQWASPSPNSDNYLLGYFFPYGYMDDGAEHNSPKFIHVTRVPTPENNPIYDVTEFKIIHLQFMNPERNSRKQRWYQCMELDNPSIAKDAIDIFRKYHHENTIANDRMVPIPTDWVDDYSKIGIDIKHVYSEKNYWYDEEVKKMFDKYGYMHYKKLDIWTCPFSNQDPRSITDKIIHLWLRKSQPHYYTKVRKIDNIIRKVFKY